MHLIYLIHEFHNLSWITEINELFHDIQIYSDAPVLYNFNCCIFVFILFVTIVDMAMKRKLHISQNVSIGESLKKMHTNFQ